MNITYTTDQLFQFLDSILTPEISSLINSMEDEPGTKSSPFVILPSSSDVDLYPEEVARLIAKTANQHSKACRLAGLARAQFKIAEGRYKHKFKSSLINGKNEAERQALASIAAKDEFDKMVLLESIVELCESIETAARISSESSRRMLLGADQIVKSDTRAERFGNSEDFSTY